MQSSEISNCNCALMLVELNAWNSPNPSRSQFSVSFLNIYFHNFNSDYHSVQVQMYESDSFTLTGKIGCDEESFDLRQRPGSSCHQLRSRARQCQVHPPGHEIINITTDSGYEDSFRSEVRTVTKCDHLKTFPALSESTTLCGIISWTYIQRGFPGVKVLLRNK